MVIKEFVNIIEQNIVLHAAEAYDNCGLLVGELDQKVSKVLICLECNDMVLQEALDIKADLIVSHHPLIFKPIKSFVGISDNNKILLKLIRSNISLYCMHTNIDNLLYGVNQENADKLGLINTKLLSPKIGLLRKIVVFVPSEHSDKVKQALFAVGAGSLGNYEHCSFVTSGLGGGKPVKKAKPFTGTKDHVSVVNEDRLEVLYHYWLEKEIIKALLNSHPYEEVAYDLLELNNASSLVGSGIIGELKNAVDTQKFIDKVKHTFNCSVIKHTKLIKPKVKKIAFCGGSGSFLIEEALKAKADVFITADIKYHDFFKAEGRLILLDIGHYESEQFVPNLINDILSVKMPKLEFFLSKINTNPVFYY